MAQQDGIIRFEPDGPAGSGLVEWPAIDPATLVEGRPVQRGHLNDDDAATGYMAGVWDCTAFTARACPYATDEFMLLLEGTVIMVMPDGTEVAVHAGQAFVVPKGLDCQWKQPGYVRKFFMIVDTPAGGAASNPSLGRVTLPPLDGPADASGAVTSTRTWFSSSDGRTTVTTRDCTAMDTVIAPSPANELVHVVSGAVTLRTEDGSTAFQAGETFYLRQGTQAGWSVAAGTRLLIASHTAGQGRRAGP